MTHGKYTHPCTIHHINYHVKRIQKGIYIYMQTHIWVYVDK